MSRPDMSPASVQFAQISGRASHREEDGPEADPGARNGTGLEGSSESGFVVEWQLLPLARPESASTEPEETAGIRLARVGWQG